MSAAHGHLREVLAAMRPRINDGPYVFCSVANGLEGANPVVVVEEDEGRTLVLRQADADEHRLTYGYVAAWITLTVHSELEAVGLTAAVSGALADAGLSCNVVAGFFHDHLFVPYDERQRALAAIERLVAANVG